MLFTSSSLLTHLLIPTVHKFLLKSNAVKKNFRREIIITCMGIVLVPVVIFCFSIAAVFLILQHSILLIFLCGVLSISFAGIIDDLLGENLTSGFKGHIGYLIKGKLTTGGLKAVIGGFIAGFISLISSNSIYEVAINTL